MKRSESTIPAARVLLILIAVIATSGRAAAQRVPQVEPVARASAGIAGPRPVAVARRTEEAVLLDGTLDDTAWQNAIPMTGFVQADPLEGDPPSELTEVRMLYDDEAIYIGVTNYDSDPSQIVTTDTRRDSSLGDQDSFQMILDTYRDSQNGFVFGTNALGAEYDAQVRSQDNPTTSWDGSWEVETRVTENAWIAEFRIPLRTLRYGPPPQVWGVNFVRNIQRHREKSFWSPLPRQYDLSRLTSAASCAASS